MLVWENYIHPRTAVSSIVWGSKPASEQRTSRRTVGGLGSSPHWVFGSEYLHGSSVNRQGHSGGAQLGFLRDKFAGGSKGLSALALLTTHKDLYHVVQVPDFYELRSWGYWVYPRRQGMLVQHWGGRATGRGRFTLKMGLSLWAGCRRCHMS